MASYNCGGVVIKVDDLVSIAVSAGEAIMEIYKDTENWDVKMKGDETPLTKADLVANKIICDGLSSKYPSIPIISEENKLVPYETRSSYNYCFLVDPLDGTKEFIKRNGQFTVNIGLCVGGEPVMGVVRCPALDIAKTYFGVVGDMANVEDDADRYPARIRCKEFSEDDEGLIIVSSLSHSNKETEDFIAKFKNPKTISMGSSLKLLLVAEGEAHVYPRLAPTSEWDTCAAHAIVVAAGGEVLQFQGGQPAEPLKPLVYNKMEVLNPYFVAYGKRRSNKPQEESKSSTVPAKAQKTTRKETINNWIEKQMWIIFPIVIIVMAIGFYGFFLPIPEEAWKAVEGGTAPAAGPSS